MTRPVGLDQGRPTARLLIFFVTICEGCGWACCYAFIGGFFQGLAKARVEGYANVHLESTPNDGETNVFLLNLPMKRMSFVGLFTLDNRYRVTQLDATGMPEPHVGFELERWHARRPDYDGARRQSLRPRLIRPVHPSASQALSLSMQYRFVAVRK